MDGTRNDVDQIETGLENTDINENNEDHDGSIEENALEVPTFGFKEKSWRSDFVLIVEGTRLYVNKAMLYLASPVFDTMFQSDFKERSCDELELPGKKLRDVADFLRYIYPCTVAQMTQESALSLLPLVEEYQVLHLKPRCETALLENVSNDTPVEELFRILHVACIYNLVNLRKQCVQKACMKSQEDIDEAFENNPPPAEAAKEILEQLNRKLRETVSEQKRLIDGISREATESTEAFKAKNIEQARQLDILKQYLSADLKKNKVISLESDIYWRESTIILDVNVEEENIKVEKEVTIWNVPLIICISEQSIQKISHLHIKIRSKTDKIKSELKGRVFVVNRQPQGGNETVLINGSIRPGSLLHDGVSQGLMKISVVMKIANGFLSDGHIGIIVQLYMSEPNRG